MTVLPGLFLMLVASSPVAQAVPATEAELDAYLRRRVQSEQASLPRVAGEGFTFKSVALAGREMSYAIEVKDMTPDDVVSGFDDMTASGCASVGMFIARGVTYRYVYEFPETGDTRTLVLNQETCPAS
ncbi:MAG: hypothetical protein EON91_08080 [Brevundimonas sp.]|uniref:hypothetical protein n=1 Tax=Brevundimonas sp. TaxID=1871086 RepID=UPI00121D2A1E|nr:hypothetical protein [Brevundimonas sp.]RZJ17787.1 MAG: hypothetical protein EON91_08080 [Brevundimonas sp.]